MQRIEVPPNVGVVDINLELTTSDYQRFKATLVNDRLEPLKTRSLTPIKRGTANLLVFQVNESVLPKGEYRIHLSGIRSDGRQEEIGNYDFRVSRL